MSPSAAAAFGLCASMPRALLGNGIDVEPAGRAACRKRGEPVEQHVGGVFAGLGQRALAVDLRLDVGAAQFDVDRLLDVVGEAFLDDQHGALAGAERRDLLRHQRIDDVEHQIGMREVPNTSASPRRSSARSTLLVSPPMHDDADVGEIAVDESR